MQVAAEAENWERFVELQQAYQQITAVLPPLSLIRVEPAERAKLVAILQQTQQTLNVLLPLAEARRTYLSGELASTHNAGKLKRTYQP